MSTTRKSRWRNSRQSIPAQRHQRRQRRRHVRRGGTYYPMVSDTAVAKSWISKQLRLGTVSVASAVAFFILCISSSQFMTLIFLGFGFIALAFGVAFIASARREEKMHLRVECNDEQALIASSAKLLIEDPNDRVPPDSTGEDGSL